MGECEDDKAAALLFWDRDDPETSVWQCAATATNYGAVAIRDKYEGELIPAYLDGECPTCEALRAEVDNLSVALGSQPRSRDGKPLALGELVWVLWVADDATWWEQMKVVGLRMAEASLQYYGDGDGGDDYALCDIYHDKPDDHRSARDAWTDAAMAEEEE